MADALKSYMSRNVPRYTSYPTAPHFSNAVGPQDYARWLAALDPDAPVVTAFARPHGNLASALGRRHADRAGAG